VEPHCHCRDVEPCMRCSETNVFAPLRLQLLGVTRQTGVVRKKNMLPFFNSALSATTKSDTSDWSLEKNHAI
jgi:hypothetical protein